MRERRRLDELQQAYRDFERRRFDAVVERLEGHPTGQGRVGEGMLLAAKALVLEGQGLTSSASPLMEKVVAMGVPLPAILDEASAFFSRSGQHERAGHAFLMADVLAPRGPRGVLDGVPEAERVRYAPWAIRAALNTPRGDGYYIGEMKAMLEEYLGPEEAALVVASMREPRKSWPRNRAVQLPLTRLIDYAREHGIDYDEVIPEKRMTLSPPQIVGQAAPEPFEAMSRTLFTCVLEDVMAIGKSNLLRVGDDLLFDTQVDELDRQQIDLRVDAAVATVCGEEVLAIGPRDLAAVRAIPEAVWLVGIHSAEFGHWLSEFLPKIVALMARPGLADVPILIDPGMPAQHLQALRLFLGQGIRTIELKPGEHVRVSRLWVASQLVFQPPSPADLPGKYGAWPVDGDAAARLLGMLESTLQEAGSLDEYERVYLPRRPWQAGSIENADEVEAELERHGFVTFDPWDHSFLRQLQVIRGARYLVAPEGSNMAMAMFARPGLHIGLMGTPYLEGYEWYTELYRALGHHLAVAIGEVERVDPEVRSRSDFKVEIATLRQLLEELGVPGALGG